MRWFWGAREHVLFPEDGRLGAVGCKANLAKDMQQLYWAEKIRSKLFETSLGDPHLWEVKRENEIKIKLECEKKSQSKWTFPSGWVWTIPNLVAWFEVMLGRVFTDNWECANLADGSNAKSTAILTWINSNFACRRYFKYIGSEPLNYTFFILVYYLFYGSTQIFIESCNNLFIVLSNLLKWQNKGKCTNCLSRYKSDIKLSLCKIISKCNVNYVVNLS